MDIFVTIKSVTGLTLIIPHGDGASVPSGAYGGSQAVQRYGNKPIREWAGRGLEEYPVPLLLHSRLMNSNVGVEWAKNQLESLAVVPEGYDDLPKVRVSGAMLFRNTQRRWVINNLEWDYENFVRNEHGLLTVAPVVMTLLEESVDETLRDLATAVEAYKNKAKKRGPDTYTAKKGDTLTKIASNILNDRKKWKAIRDLNKLKSNKDVKKGQVIKLP